MYCQTNALCTIYFVEKKRQELIHVYSEWFTSVKLCHQNYVIIIWGVHCKNNSTRITFCYIPNRCTKLHYEKPGRFATDGVGKYLKRSFEFVQIILWYFSKSQNPVFISSNKSDNKKRLFWYFCRYFYILNPFLNISYILNILGAVGRIKLKIYFQLFPTEFSTKLIWSNMTTCSS